VTKTKLRQHMMNAESGQNADSTERECEDPLAVNCKLAVHGKGARYCMACARTCTGTSIEKRRTQRRNLVKRRLRILQQYHEGDLLCSVEGCPKTRYSKFGCCLYCWDHRNTSKEYCWRERTQIRKRGLSNETSTDDANADKTSASSFQRCIKCNTLTWSPFNSNAVCSKCTVFITQKAQKEENAVQALLALGAGDADKASNEPSSTLLQQLSNQRNAIEQTNLARLHAMDAYMGSVQTAVSKFEQCQQAAKSAYQELENLTAQKHLDF